MPTSTNSPTVGMVAVNLPAAVLVSSVAAARYTGSPLVGEPPAVVKGASVITPIGITLYVVPYPPTLSQIPKVLEGVGVILLA